MHFLIDWTCSNLFELSFLARRLDIILLDSGLVKSDWFTEISNPDPPLYFKTNSSDLRELCGSWFPNWGGYNHPKPLPGDAPVDVSHHNLGESLKIELVQFMVLYDVYPLFTSAYECSGLFGYVTKLLRRDGLNRKALEREFRLRNLARDQNQVYIWSKIVCTATTQQPSWDWRGQKRRSRVNVNVNVQHTRKALPNQITKALWALLGICLAE